MLVQDLLQQNPFSGHIFVFRGRRSDRVKILYYDQDGMCLFAKRLDQGKSTWPTTRDAPGGTVTLSPAQLSMLSEGLEWRTPVRTWEPVIAG